MSDSEKSPHSSSNDGDNGANSPMSATSAPNQKDSSREDKHDSNGDKRRSNSQSSYQEGKSSANRDYQEDVSNPGNNLYVANLAHRVDDEELKQLFEKYGRLEKCEIIVDPLTKESRGFAFVTFEDMRDAADAVQELNGKEVQGRPIRVEHAKRKCGHPKTPGQYLGPRLASVKYGRDNRRDRSRDRGFDRRRSRSRSRDRGSRRYDDRDGDRQDRRFDDRRGHGGFRHDNRRSRR